MRWIPLMATFSKETSETICEALKFLGFEAEYKKSKPDHTIYVRDEEEVVRELARILRQLKDKLFFVYVTEKGQELQLKVGLNELIDILPTREQVYAPVFGLPYSEMKKLERKAVRTVKIEGKAVKLGEETPIEALNKRIDTLLDLIRNLSESQKILYLRSLEKIKEELEKGYVKIDEIVRRLDALEKEIKTLKEK